MRPTFSDAPSSPPSGLRFGSLVAQGAAFNVAIPSLPLAICYGIFDALHLAQSTQYAPSFKYYALFARMAVCASAYLVGTALMRNGVLVLSRKRFLVASLVSGVLFSAVWWSGAVGWTLSLLHLDSSVAVAAAAFVLALATTCVVLSQARSKVATPALTA